MSAIIACIWQGLAVAWLTALLLRLTPRLNAATRHAIWWLALATVLALPLAHFVALTVAPPGAALATTVDANTPALLLPAPPDWLIAGIAGAWLGSVLLGLARLVYAIRLIAGVRRRSIPMADVMQRSLTLWTAVRGSGRRPELRLSHEVSGACALGLTGRPVVLISTRLAAALEAEELDQIVMHEHAHLARYDDWLRMFQSLVIALCGLHPAVHFINARIDLEREAACDDRVVSRTGAADRYASCLANAADLARRRLPLSLEPILAPHASQSRGALVIRVKRLLDPRASRDAHLKWACTGMSLLAFSIAVLISPAAQPLVVVLGVMTGTPQLQVAPAIRRVDARPPLLSPSLLPSMGEALPASPAPDLVPASETTTVVSDLSTPSSPATAVSLVRQFSWTMPVGMASGPPLPAEPNRVLPATQLAPLSMPAAAGSKAAPPESGEPDVASESAWKAAGYTGAAVGIGVARAGVATGSGSRKAGTAVAGFFSRAGKAVAGSF
jgi:beta-lactamase regulating signal transducer with metallopeptidase domain